MSDFFAMPAVQTVFSLMILGVLVASGVWLVSIFRDRIDNDQETVSELLSNFEEMVREGDISASEFRTIEAVVDGKSANDAERSGKQEAS